MKLTNIKEQTTWREAVNALNDNNQKVENELLKVTSKNRRGFFVDEYTLLSLIPQGNIGDVAYVGRQSPYTLFYWTEENGWVEYADTVPINNIDITNFITKDGGTIDGHLTVSSAFIENDLQVDGEIGVGGYISSFGFKVSEKTNEDIILAGGGTIKVDDLLIRFNKTVKHTSDEQEVTIEPNTFHVWDSVYMLYVTLGEAKEGEKSEYLFQFTAGVWFDECLIDAPFPLRFNNTAWKYGHTYLVHIVNGNGTVYEYEPFVPYDEIWFYTDGTLIAPNLSNLSDKYGPIAYTYDAYAGKHILKTEGAWIREIPAETFAYSNLWSVMLPTGGGVEIGNYAFSDCENLQNIYMPFIEKIGIEAFRESPIGGTIDLGYCESIGEGAFEGTSINEITIPQSITTIPVNCFYGCWNLNKVKLSEGLKVIGTSAFSDCSNLKYITIPSTVEHLGEEAFLGCTSLKKIEVPSGVLELFERCFAGCTSLEEVIWHEGKSGVDSRSIYSQVFSGCTNLRKVTIPEGVFDIQHEVFANTAISTLVLPSTVADIDSYAFGQMPNLQTIYCKAPRTPYVDSGFMMQVSTIYVPEGVVGNYQSANGWSEFANVIVGHNFAGPWDANLANYYDKREIDNMFSELLTRLGLS